MRGEAWLRRPYFWLLLSALALVAGYLLAPRASVQAQSPGAPRAAGPVPVIVATVVQEDLPQSLTGIGTVMAAASVTVRSRVDGQLERVAFREGQDVAAGALLAQIDPRPFRAQLEQARAQQAKDKASLVNARTDLARYLKLAAEDSISDQQVATQRALVRQLEATAANDQAQVDYAALQLGYTTITAPIAGRTGALLVDAGNMVHASDSSGLVVINRIDPISVQFTLPQRDFDRIIQAQRGGPPLTVTALAREDGHPLASGRLLFVNNQIDPGTGTLQMKAEFANPAHRLWPGMYVDARLQLGKLKGVLTVPAHALQRNQNGPYVYLLKADHTVALQPVTPGETVGDKVVIAGGLKAGERVVSDGQYKLKPGARIVEQPSAGAVR
jgi:multidrug efflux system membrane fusion protein